MKRALIADFSLISVGAIWGLNFTVIKYAIGVIPPMQFIGLRFLISTLVLSIIYRRRFRNMNRAELVAGCYIGIFLFLGFLTQTIGLQFTTPGKSGFITSLYIVIVPFIASFLYKKFVGWIPISGAILAFMGLCLISLSGNETLTLNMGELLTLACTLCYALHILTIEYYSVRYDPYVLCLIQVAFTSVMSLSYSVAYEAPQFTVPNMVWGALAFTSLLGTCVAFVVQNVAQQDTSSSHTALLLGLEAPFSLLFSVLIWGEAITMRGFAGSLLIFAAIILIEVGPMVFPNKQPNNQLSD